MASPVRVIGVISAAVFAIAGCGGSPTSTGESGLKGQPVIFGFVGPLSGALADNGKALLLGAQVAVAELNAGKGILGRPVQLIEKDDVSDPTKSAQYTRELIDQQNADFILGSLSSGLGTQMPITNSAKKIEMALGSLPDAGDVTKNPYTFRATYPSTVQADSEVKFALASGWKRIGVMAVNTATGTSFQTGFNASVKGKPVEVAGVQVFDTGAVDLTAQMIKLLAAKPDVIMVFCSGTDQIAVVKARNQLGSNVPLVGIGTLADPSVAQAVGADGMKAVFAGPQFPGMVRSQNGSEPALIAHVKKFEKASTVTTDIHLAGNTYDSVMMLAAGADKVGSVDDTKIKQRLETLGPDGYKGIVGAYHYDSQRHDGMGVDAAVFVVAGSFKDGAYDLAPHGGATP